MNKLISLSLLLLSCSTIEHTEVTPTKIVTSNVSNEKPRLTEFVFNDFSALGQPPAANFHSIQFLWTLDTVTLFPLVELRMGYNELYQSDSSGNLWIIQSSNGYAYFHPYLNLYEVVKMTLVYYDGTNHIVLPYLENKSRIPSQFGYNPIVKIIIQAKEYQ